MARANGKGRIAAAFIAALTASAARAQTPAEFYKGRTIFIDIGSATGGVYDVVGRILARHMGRHIPGNPTIVPRNVPGGGSLALANQFASITPRDGTAFGIFNNGMPTTPLLDPQAGHFDPRRFGFLGSPSRETHILVIWHDAPVQKYEDLFTKELVLGATSPGAAPYDFPRLTNALIGTRFKIVTGYVGGQETQLAMRRGEVYGQAGIALGSYKTDYQDAARAHEVRILAGFGMRQHPELKDIPLFPTGKTDEERQLFQLMYARQDYGRPLAVPEGVPKDRLAALRQAFADTMKDPDFRAEADRAGAEIDPVAPEELETLTQRVFATSPATVERMRGILSASK
jgi:tripartite-type tricarboxylate transporter receptor subunit TctC